MKREPYLSEKISEYTSGYVGPSRETICHAIRCGSISSETTAFLMTVISKGESKLEISDEYIRILQLDEADGKIFLKGRKIDHYCEDLGADVELQMGGRNAAKIVSNEDVVTTQFLSSIHYSHRDSNIPDKSSRLAVYAEMKRVYNAHLLSNNAGLCALMDDILMRQSDEILRTFIPYFNLTVWPEMLAVKPKSSLAGAYWWNPYDVESRKEAIDEMIRLVGVAKK